MISRRAPVAKSVDAADLKSAFPKGECRFESGPGHQRNANVNLLTDCPTFATVHLQVVFNGANACHQHGRMPHAIRAIVPTFR